MRVIVCALALCAFPAAAFCQDRASSRVAQAFSGIDWSGLYLGGGAAYLGAGGGSNAAGSIFAGYSFDAGPGIAGLETGLILSDVRTDTGERLNSMVDLRGRIGVAFDRFQFYGTGGAVWSPYGNRTDTGYAAGAGVDWAATGQTFWGLQYVRYAFPNFRNTGNTLEVDLISGRISYKF